MALVVYFLTFLVFHPLSSLYMLLNFVCQLIEDIELESFINS